MDLIGLKSTLFKGKIPNGKNQRMDFQKAGSGLYPGHAQASSKATVASMIMDAQADGQNSAVLQKLNSAGSGQDVLYLTGKHNLKAGEMVSAVDDYQIGRRDLGQYKVVFAD